MNFELKKQIFDQVPFFVGVPIRFLGVNHSNLYLGQEKLFVLGMQVK